jgi:hypothetical protein
MTTTPVQVRLVFGQARLSGSGSLELDSANVPAQVAIALDEQRVVVGAPIWWPDQEKQDTTHCVRGCCCWICPPRRLRVMNGLHVPGPSDKRAERRRTIGRERVSF